MPRVSSDGSARPLYVNVAFQQEEIGRRRRWRRRATGSGSAQASRAHTYNYSLLLFDGWMFLGVKGPDCAALLYAVFPVLTLFSRKTTGASLCR